jgi:hypothetical protein
MASIWTAGRGNGLSLVPSSTRFAPPISLPAGNCITELPKTENEAPEWQAAMEALILVATHGGPTMFACINESAVKISQAVEWEWIFRARLALR